MYIIVSYGLGILCAVAALSGISQGRTGPAIFAALIAAVFIWGRAHRAGQAPAPRSRARTSHRRARGA